MDHTLCFADLFQQVFRFLLDRLFNAALSHSEVAQSAESKPPDL